jgi:integrase
MALTTAKAIDNWKPKGAQEFKPCGNRLGLYLRGSESGSKIFYWRKVGRWFALGEYGKDEGQLSLPDAIGLAAECNKRFKQGTRPEEIIGAYRGLESITDNIPAEPSKARQGRVRKVRASGKIHTYEDAFEAYCAAYEANRQAGPSRNQPRSLHRYHVPNDFAKLPIREIRRGDIFDWMLELLREKHETARKLRSLMDSVFEFAINKGACSDNPVPSQRSFKIPMPKRKPRGSLVYTRLPELWHWLDGSRSKLTTIMAVKLVMLSAHRVGVVQAARWEHIDPDTRQWTIPEREDKEAKGLMKSGRQHTTTLPKGFMEELLAIKGNTPWLFPSLGSSDFISEPTIRKLLKRFDSDITAHGFRNTFKTWARNEGFADWIADAYVDHSLKGLDASYRREDPARIVAECAKVTETLYEYCKNG